MAIRCSRIPRGMICGPSMFPSDFEVDTKSPEGKIGTAVHAVLAATIGLDRDSVSDKQIEQAAYVEDCDLSEVAWLSRSAFKIWREQFAGKLIVCGVEVSMASDIGPHPVTGTADLICTRDNALVVVDWKTGIDSGCDFADQLIPYAILATDRMAVVRWDTVKIVTIWARSGEYTIRDFSPAEIAQWTARFVKRAADDKVCPGDHCAYCPKMNACHGYLDMMRGSATALTEIGKDESRAVTPALLASLYPRAQQLEKVLAKYKDACRAAVAEAGGKLDIGNGSYLTIEESERVAIQFDPAVFAAMLTPDELRQAVSVSKKDLLDAVAARAPRGQKANIKEQVMEELRAKGLVETSVVRKLVTKKGE